MKDHPVKLTVCCMVVAVCVLATTNALKQKPDEITEANLREANTLIIEAIGEVAALMHDNSDVIMRYSHHTDGHRSQVLVCPECTFGLPSAAPPEPEHYDDTDTRPDQDLLEDCGEILQSLQTLQYHLKYQHTGLSYTLKRLREHTAAMNKLRRKPLTFPNPDKTVQL